MKLLTNSKCQLILDGEKPEMGLEVIVYGDKYTIIERENDLPEFFFDMPEDGLFQYFVLIFEEEPEDLLEYIQDMSIVPDAEIFSICKLRNCLLDAEKNYITKFLRGCNTNSYCNDDKESNIKDFLLVSIFVLEHLICTNQITEASRILKNLRSCSLCDNVSINDCGCNGRNK